MKANIQIEFPSCGATYSNDVYGVYEYDEYPMSSVLAGQSRRTWLDEFDSLEEAQAAYPNAVFNDAGSSYQPLNISRIAPDWFDESYAGERWDDDY